MAVKTEHPSKVTIIQRFETPWMRPGEFTIRLAGRTGQLNYLSPELVTAIQNVLQPSDNGTPTPNSEILSAQAKITLDILKRDPSRLDWRWFRFKRRIYHPELGGKKTLVTALTPFDFTQMVFGRGRRGHQMAGFFSPKVISINRPPTKDEWLEAQTLVHIERNGTDPTPDDIKHFKKLYRSRPPLGPEKRRWITLLWMPTDTIQGAEEIRNKSDLIVNVAVQSSKLLMREGPKIAHYDELKAHAENVLGWSRDIERSLHMSNVALMKEAHRRMDLQQQSATEGMPRMVPPVMHEFPQMPSAAGRERRLAMPSMPDFGKFMPLIAVLLGVGLLAGGAWTYMQTASMPNRSGADIATLGGIILVIGMIIGWLQSRGQSPSRKLPSAQLPQSPNEPRPPVTEEQRSAS